MRTVLTFLSSTLIILAVSSASAQALYWDPGQTSSATAGGSGNWDTTSTFWFNGTSDVPWTSGDDAWFEGTAGTVTLMQNTSAADLYFTNATGNYYITNATSTEVLSVANTIDTGGGEHTIAAFIANSGTLNKNGAGRLHLPVNNTAGLTGSVMINQGSLSAETNNALGAFNTITVADGAAVEFNGVISNNNNGYNNFNISGTGITNSGAIRNISGQTVSYGTITVAENNSLFYADSGSFHSYGGLSANGNYNLNSGGPGIIEFDSGNFNIGAGTVIVQAPSTFNMYAAPSSVTFGGVLVEKGGTYGVDQDGDFGPIPSSQDTTNVILDGGTVASVGNYTMNGARGITATTNGGTISDTSTTGTFTTGSIYCSNSDVTFNSSATIHIAASAGTNILNLGTGRLIKNGNGDAGTSFNTTTQPIFSNLVVNAGSYTFNYDQSSGQFTGLGLLPATLNPSNIVLNGGSLHVGHSTTIGSTRGMYVTTKNGTIQDVTSSATLTINSPITGPGSMSFPLGKSGSSQTVVLTGANTYSGTTTVGGSITLSVGNNGSTGSLGTGNTTDSGTLTFKRTGSYTYGGNISGSGPVNNAASGTVTLAGACTYTGATTVSAGTLIMNNTNASAITVSSGGTLGGTGVFGGTVTISSGGTLALGSGTLSASNNVSIAGNVSVSLNKSLTPSNGTAIVTGTLANTGTGSVVVTNLGPSLVAGDTFRLFSQPLTGGGTMKISGGGAGVVWNNNLAVDGTISVQSVVPPSPRITNVQISNGNFILSGANGPGSGTYYLLTSTNVMLPLNQWTSVLTNTFLSNGQFFITNPITPGTPQLFYLLQVQ